MELDDVARELLQIREVLRDDSANTQSGLQFKLKDFNKFKLNVLE